MLSTSYYDKARADKVINFVEKLLKHTKGEWAGQPFKLMPWQEKILRDIFGTINADGSRQFRTAYITCGKKNGKSELAAAIALYMLCADGEASAEIYGCANDRHQAEIVFNVAKGMVIQQPLLDKHIKIVDSRKRLIYRPTSSFYEAVSSEVSTKYGLNVSCCVFDELLGQKDRKLYEVMTKGSGAARTQPLNFVISTAGDNQNSICYELHQKAIDIIEGRKTDPTFYPAVFGANPNDDWTCEETWKKANPSYGITVKSDFYRAMCESAKDNVAEENHFRQFFLNQWVKNSVRWLSLQTWDKCAFTVDPEKLRGRTCYGGLDLSSTSDLTAFILVFPPEYEDERYEILCFFWLPQGAVDTRSKKQGVNYDKWIKDGLIMTTEGNALDYNIIQDFIITLGIKYKIAEIAYDDWNAMQTVLYLQDKGFTMANFGQGFRSMSAPCKELLRLVLKEQIAHGGNEVLRWNADNIFIKTDPAGNIKPDKERSAEKIDGIVALVMALGRAVVNTSYRKKSVYEERGLVWL